MCGYSGWNSSHYFVVLRKAILLQFGEDEVPVNGNLKGATT
jgi:hypothetical protein